MAWGALTRVDTWKYYFYREHVQIQFFPVGVVLLLPWTVRRWLNARRPAWACGQCGYDRRGGVGGPCPECGAVLPAQASEAVG